MAASNFVKYDAPGLEPKIANEAEKIQALHDLVNRIQQKNFACHRHGFRGTHVKTQGIVKGKLTVLPDLPKHLSQGLFSKGGKEHDIAIRFANEPSFLQDDRTARPRGCGMKVFDVDGEFMDPAGRESRTHDFTFNNAPVLEPRDLPTCLEVFQLREK
jgi:catalase